MTPQEAFAEGRYFEAHELWESEWLRAEGEERRYLQGLVQMAVAFHHRSRGNRKGFEKLRERALPKLPPALAELLRAEDESGLRAAVRCYSDS